MSPHVPVYFTLPMWLFMNLGDRAVLRELVENFPRRRGELWRPVRTGSVTEAGPGWDRPRCAGCSSGSSGVMGSAATLEVFWRPRRQVPRDGTCFDVLDSQANAAAYTRPSKASRPAVYPQVRMVALGECGTRARIGAAFDSSSVGERTLAVRLVPLVKPHLLLMADRGSPSFAL